MELLKWEELTVKRLFSLLLLAALLCALAVPAAADVAYMPRDNFVEKHFQECRRESRWYWTNGAAGYVLAHKTPESKEATPLPNGGKYYISNIYQDRWGVLEYDPETLENRLSNGSVSGWVDMDEMVVDYDNQSFMADHAAELVSDPAELELHDDTVVCSYLYPGSGELLDTLQGWWSDGEVLSLSPVFTDPAGRRWGLCGYFYGHRDFWVCIDDPGNAELPADENHVAVVTRDAAPAPTEAPEPTQAPSPTPAPAGKTIELTPPADDAAMQQAAKENGGSGPYLLAGAGGVIVVAAAVLAAALKKRKQ